MIVELLPASQSVTNSERESNIVSTSLIRETRSYHLLAIFDPLKNDEITIKEAIARGILDRQKGLYIHPITKESFSISDAINKGVIRARILTPPPDDQLPYQSLISTNRFEENRTYTIVGAVDPRTGKKISFSQAMREGIIDGKNGTYINLKTGDVYPMNKAIELKLVLTDSCEDRVQQNQQVPTTQPKREIRTLNIESVRDTRTGRNLCVSEAMLNGILDRETLNYRNPLTNEVLSLSKAYHSGYIIGHYTDRTETTTRYHYTQKTVTEERSYLIVSVYDPTSNKQLTLDQAVQLGLFDYNRGVYVHPVNREEIEIGDAMRKGLIDAQVFDNAEAARRYDTRLPVGDFGVDKRITSMRTKFNKDGSSVLQIDIESTKPTKGIYDVDEVEDIQRLPIQNQNHRQRIDINSVHRVNGSDSSDSPSKIHQQIIHITQPVHKEKNVLITQINKEFGSDIDLKRVEKVVDDEHSSVLKILVDNSKKRPKEIPERSNHTETTTVEHLETLVIDESKVRNQSVNIDGQTHVFKKEVLINEPAQSSTIGIQITEFNKKLVEIENQKKITQINKMPEAQIIDTKTSTITNFIDLSDSGIRQPIVKKIDIGEDYFKVYLLFLYF